MTYAERLLAPPTDKYSEKTKKRLIRHSKIDLESGCWNWLKYKNKGYGIIGYNRGIYLAHRVSFYLFNGPFDESLHVCHKCDNPSCINPAHLFAGTPKDNVQDCLSKKRFNRQIDIRKGELNNACTISDKIVAEIYQKIKLGIKQTAIAKEYGIGDSSVSRIKRGYRVKNQRLPVNLKPLKP